MKVTKSGDMGEWAQKKFRGARKAMREVMEDTTELGAETMQYNIATRGTEKSGKPGRIDTSRMHDSVNHRIDEETTQGEDYRIVGSFGWDEADFADARTPSYPLIQEGGFNHVLSSGYVEPMMALSDSIEDVKRTLEAGFDKAIARNTT